VGYEDAFKIIRCLKLIRSKVASKMLGKYIYICVQADMVSLTKLCHLLKNILKNKCELLTVELLFSFK